jgi:hypothetical protein
MSNAEEYRDLEQRIAEIVRSQLQHGESLDDVMAGARYLASNRARFLGRDVIIDIDLVHVLKMWTWWPFKPKMPYELERYLHRIRRIAFRGVAGGDMQRLDAATPNATLLLEAEGLRALQLHGDPQDIARPLSEE